MGQMRTMEVKLTADNARQDTTVKSLDQMCPQDSVTLVTTAQAEHSHPLLETTWSEQ